MSWRTNSLVVKLRNMGRMLGLNGWIASFRSQGEYEALFDKEFSGGIQRGDCVWDVGANVGHFTRIFSERVGDLGRVFAFEPSRSNFHRLATACTSLKNVVLLPIGLGSVSGQLRFQQSVDGLGDTSRIVDTDSEGVFVDIRSGTSVISEGIAKAPNAIKIDVEGFECEVLEGLDEHLKQSILRLIGIEVHFGLLKARGLSQAPKQIEELLIERGFNVKWTDASHIVAVRGT